MLYWTHQRPCSSRTSCIYRTGERMKLRSTPYLRSVGFRDLCMQPRTSTACSTVSVCGYCSSLRAALPEVLTRDAPRMHQSLSLLPTYVRVGGHQNSRHAGTCHSGSKGWEYYFVVSLFRILEILIRRACGLSSPPPRARV